MEMTIEEKHELTLSFNSSEELWEFAKEHEDKIAFIMDYKFNIPEESEDKE
jgi:hypothetical protein